MSTFAIKQHNRLPSLRLSVTGVGDLTGGAVRFHMRRADGGPVVVDAAAVLESVGDDDDSAVLRYDWAVGDTLTPGLYDAEFEVTVAAKVISCPNDGYIAVTVTTVIA
jgi:hypothetical protein